MPQLGECIVSLTSAVYINLQATQVGNFEASLSGSVAVASLHAKRLFLLRSSTFDNSFDMKLNDKIANRSGSSPFYTFEFFPPKTDQVYFQCGRYSLRQNSPNVYLGIF